MTKAMTKATTGMEVRNSNASVKFKDAKLVGQQESTACSENISEGKYIIQK